MYIYIYIIERYIQHHHSNIIITIIRKYHNAISYPIACADSSDPALAQRTASRKHTCMYIHVCIYIYIFSLSLSLSIYIYISHN